MAQEENMTREQVEEEMRQLRKVFDSVQLFTQEMIQNPKGRRPCYAHWKRTRPCENCVARRALEEKGRKSRLEYMGKTLYEVTACYVLVEDRPCVLEMAQKMDRGMVLGSDDSGRLLDTITDQRERLYRDPATGAYNRLYYDENYRGRSMTAGVALLDLDDLKLSNDVYGRAAGDSVLETAVNVIRRGLTEKDRLIRYNSGELLLLLPDIGQEQFSRRLEQIRLQLRTARIPGYSRIQMSASIGGVWVEDESLEIAVDHAQRLMHYASIQKNTVVTERQTESRAAGASQRRQSVLIVDDSAMNRALLSQMLGRQYDTAEAAGGEECLRLLEQNPTGISIVLLDIHMDGMNGFDVLEAMNQRGMLEEIPVIMISSEDTADSVRRAFDLGASDYIGRPFDAKVVYQRVSNAIRLYAKQRRLSAMVADQVCEIEKRSRMMIDILSRVVERRNGESHAHAQRISILTNMLLTHLAQKTDSYPLSQEMRQTIGMASMLHDIGKMEVDDQIRSGSAHTLEELERMRQHTVLGAKMLEELDAYRDEDFVQTACQICRWHHERYDGSGYPDHLAGEQIPIAAQVVGLADAYETLVSGSETQPPMPHREALKQLCEADAKHFNPLLLECLQEIGAEIGETMQHPEKV